jgi:hypothetical protein
MEEDHGEDQDPYSVVAPVKKKKKKKKKNRNDATLQRRTPMNNHS